ncbi:hypothetical protein OE749_17390 [Aestuariibacter sp. AA17]|uniref:Uncharacterized protein n=1 Tax=Fluctibacter corallii TaxID=2984329 RepID=A0ABT3ACU4_9ALTE|nr:hypothetical protein [Aestuariibacter sp. AA17]MCV2886473.1 hypothetical protein [Aestuariibacter sp. AA17]
MQEFIVLLVKLLVSIAVAAIVILFLFVYFTSIDEAHQHGQHYGFRIGDSKSKVYSKMSQNLSRIYKKDTTDKYRVNLFDENQMEPKRIHSDFGLGDKKEFDLSDKWVVLFDSKFFFDNVTLIFCDKKLCAVKRQRHFLEYP